MLDTYFKKYFWTFNLLVLFVAASLVARSVNAFIGNALRPSADRLAEGGAAPAVRPGGTEHTETVPVAAFLDRNLFKAAREDLTPPPPVDDDKPVDDGPVDMANCDPSTLGANLLATLVAYDDPTASLAVFQDTAKSEIGEYRVGDKVATEGEIIAIEWRNVYVKRGGHCEAFSLEDETKRAPTRAAIAQAPPTPAGDNDLGAGVKKTSESEYEIPREEIDNVLSNLNQVATQARIVPSFQNGKANGFKLFSIRPNSLYSKIGIQNGDIVQKINGYEINSPDKALEIYSKLKDAQSITVDLVRRGKSQTLSYNIR